jgi:hypothetical protein
MSPKVKHRGAACEGLNRPWLKNAETLLLWNNQAEKAVSGTVLRYWPVHEKRNIEKFGA